MYPIKDDQQFIAEALEAERVLLVQGTGFNWPHPDHFRLVFLPHEDDLRDAIARVARFLERLPQASRHRPPAHAERAFSARQRRHRFSVTSYSSPKANNETHQCWPPGIGTVGGGT